ncbi:hypothetical protein LCGC14_1093490 [marine sediment metagenome]|uniref:Uncharacterized protein n=1 Tax=marine sediment metagenome TaxID=412755 RepID=A0A0F9PUT7_9ZZZZ
MTQECEYWEEGHKVMNCRICKVPNQDYCKDRFGQLNKTDGTPICPRCGEVYIKSALSRLDNETKICSNCGNWEAMMDYRFLFEVHSEAKINDGMNVLGTLIGKKDKIMNHEFKYFEKLNKILTVRLEKLHMSN